MKEFNKIPKYLIIQKQFSFAKFDKIIKKKFKTETMDSIRKRLRSFYRKSSQIFKNIIIVTHGGIV